MSKEKLYDIRFDAPAITGAVAGYTWQSKSLPLGNGYLGASLFGEPFRETIIISDNSFWTGGTPWINNRLCAGNEPVCNIFISTNDRQEEIEGYERKLSLDRAVAEMVYTRREDGVTIYRQYFMSYPDRVLAIRITSSVAGKLNVGFTLSPCHCRDQLLGDTAKALRATVTATDSALHLVGHSDYFGIDYDAQLHVVCEGETAYMKTNPEGRIDVCDADAAWLVFCEKTNYEISEKIYDDGVYQNSPDAHFHKLDGAKHPTEDVTAICQNALALGWDELLSRHLADYQSLYSRVKLDLGGIEEHKSNDRKRAEYIYLEQNPYMAELMYQHARYLLIASSRKGTLPASLQGTWNAMEIPPWTNGYWYNINVQMNYWNAFSGNIAETFDAFVNFNAVRMPAMESLASGYIKENFPEKYSPEKGQNGWIVGTGNSPYHLGKPGGHSGPGTGGLTTALYWDLYAFTQDKTTLREVVFPVLQGLARFYTKCVEKMGDDYLAKISSSPEQKIGGAGAYVQTSGCAFDPQMIYDNCAHYLEACEILGDDPIIDQALLAQIKAQIDHYSPVIIGKSGQIKEYREEEYYGEIGDPLHRHISHLVGIAPCAVISEKTPAWCDAAAVSLDKRGYDNIGGWPMAHRMFGWARLGNGEKAKFYFDRILSLCTYDNMWTNHDAGYEFQFDAINGTSASIGEMILQSHEDAISLLPALPRAWQNGSMKGMCARGGFEVDIEWQEGTPKKATIHSKAGKLCHLKLSYGTNLSVSDKNGCPVDTVVDDHTLTFATKAGESYLITGFSPRILAPAPHHLKYTLEGNVLHLSWQHSEEQGEYTLLMVEESGKTYTTIASHLTEKTYPYTMPDAKRRTFKVAYRGNGTADVYSNTVTVN
ncbi:MAG: glycoside hydrolase N-terminal domain-containing protein [Clostridia bacterium]|nr:glycoside hydrolase N-terminal domain-containing protein [Clostridia bacterium]